MVLGLGVILFSSLTCVGLLALWAALSQRHWFVRTMVFLAGVSPVLLIPAYEPFVVFVIQGATIAAGVQLGRYFKRRRNGDASLRIQFRLSTFLLAMVPLAALGAVAIKLPELNFPSWQSVVLIGISAGGAALAGCWIVQGRRPTVLWRILLGFLITLFLSLIVYGGDWFISTLRSEGSWPPMEDDGFDTMAILGYDQHQMLSWFAIVTGIVLATMLFVGLILALCRASARDDPRRWRRAAYGTLLALFIVMLIWIPAGTYYLLMNPLPLPPDNSPQGPNGYDDYVAATELLPPKPIVSTWAFEAETATDAQLRKAVYEMRPALERIRVGSAKPVWRVVDYYDEDMLLDEIDGFRSIARGFSAAVGLATREGDFDQAAAIALDSIRFGFNIGRGGLLIDTLVGYACASYGYFDLFELRKQLSPEICLQIAGHLRAIESSLEPMEDISYRDKVWTQRVFGWGAHLIQIIQDTGLPMESNWITDAWDSYDEISDRNRAVLRLLEMHFALRVWHAQFDDWPASLDLLVPEYLPTVPLDPLSTEGKPLQYRLTDDGYLLYSVGMNRTDEGGLPPDDDGNGDSDPSTGDLMLEHLYAPPAVEPAEGEAEEGE